MNQIIAHRGASAYAPENTIASFNRAWKMGARMIEFDVMLTSDGEPFIFHDDNLKRTSNGQGEIGQVNAEYLRTLDAGSWFSKQYAEEKIPSLLTALQWVLSKDIDANIEIKPYPGMTEQTTVAVVTHLNRYWPHERPLPLVSSFDRKALMLARSLSPEMPLGLLMHEWEADWLSEARKLSCFSIHLNADIVTKPRVQAMKAEGYKVYVYTVNRLRLARQLFDMGVDAVFSDYPDLLETMNVNASI